MNTSVLYENITELVFKTNIDEIADFFDAIPMNRLLKYISDDSNKFKEFCDMVMEDNWTNFRIGDEYLYKPSAEEDHTLVSWNEGELYMMLEDNIIEHVISDISDFDDRDDSAYQALEYRLNDFFGNKLGNLKGEIARAIEMQRESV